VWGVVVGCAWRRFLGQIGVWWSPEPSNTNFDDSCRALEVGVRRAGIEETAFLPMSKAACTLTPVASAR